MISDEPDEDADDLDDDKMLETYIGPGQGNATDVAVALPDWPPTHSPLNGPGVNGVGLNIDRATVAWFKANYAEWQREIGSVLRGWIVAQTQVDGDIQPSG